MIVYEYPLHERIRTYLRLESLFLRLQKLIARIDALDHHFAVATLFEIIEVSSRTDLKPELLKDLDRQKQLLEVYRENPVIDQALLDQVISDIERCYAALVAQPSKVCQPLIDNDWLMGIRNRISIPSGTCEFDLPAYYAWQNKGAMIRQADLLQWSSVFTALSAAAQLLLRLLRQSGTAQKFIANAGHFQQNLPSGRSFLLLRLGLDRAYDLIPEISGNRLMVAVRLMQSSIDQRAQLSVQDVPFELTLCP